MSRVAWLNALLLVVVAALGALAYFKPGGNAPAVQPLSRLKASEVTSIRIERPGAPAMVLEKKDAAWIMTAPLAARADPLRVQRLLEILDANPTGRLVVGGLDRFELDRPAARVTIGGQAFSFGMVNAVTREQYVMTGNAVYTVNPRYGTVLPAVPLDLASRQLLGPGEVPQRFDLEAFSVEQRDGGWRLAPAPAAELSQDDLVRWVDGWQLASAIRVEPYAGGNARPDISIQLKNGGKVALGVGASGKDVVLTRFDEKLQYYFRVDTARRLLARPAPAREERPTKK